ncbi:MAG: reverse gyrase, partial [Euryarchaeota archaeon]|nr:reverse gyrase [Euryarchaeota archaeon]
MISAIYLEMCPQCRGELSTEEIERNLCFSKRIPLNHSEIKKLSQEFENFFEEKTGYNIRSLQSMWARRVLSGYSFAAIAPTGIGKTMFGAVMAAFLAEKGKKSYLIVPTLLLLDEVRERLENMNADFVWYHGKMKKSIKEDMRKKIERGEFRILLTTTAFLSKNFSLIRGKKFHFVFVDDVDSLLKKSRNLEKVISTIHEKTGVLMVSTATGARGHNTKILREKLNFDVGNVRNTIRNVEDIYAPKDEFRKITEKMGGGALIFVSRSEIIDEVTRLLPQGSFGVVTAENKEAFKHFAEGKIEFLIGIASPYGSLVRGIDMPERIRYAIFYEIPQFTISARDIDKLSEKALVSVAHALSTVDSELRELADRGDIENIKLRIKTLAKRNIFEEDIIIENEKIIIPDVRTYIQASGRTSRLYSGGITKGASFLLDREEKIKLFQKRARFFDIELKKIDEVNLESLKRKIDEDRAKIKRSRELREVVEPTLLIVESPNKARHIAAFFGKPNRRIMNNAIIYEVSTGNRVLLIAPSLGHVVDLTTIRGFHGVKVLKNSFVPLYTAIKKCRECGYQFTDSAKCPLCGSENIYNSMNQITTLQQLAFETGNVVIGTDPDTEGEKIAWDLYNLLTPFAGSIRRGEFHEVTVKAIMNALENSRILNENLVKAQIVRRIEDRWIGFELSQILMRRFRERNLSAGRAQTPVLGWIISRYQESRTRKTAWFIEDTNVRVPWNGEVTVESKLLSEEIKDRRIPPYTTDTALKDI